MIIVGHELSTDLTTLVRSGYTLPDCEYFCTSTAAQWLEPGTDHSLEHLVLQETSMGMWRSTLGKVKPAEFDEMSDDELGRRCGGDAEGALRLYPIYKARIEQAGFQKVWALAMDVLPILAEIGGVGMRVDTRALTERATTTDRWLKKEKAALEQQLGIINLNSHIQIAEALFGRHGATPLHRTTQGYSTDRTALLWARYQAQQAGSSRLATLLSRVLDYGAQSKLASTYYQGWLDAIGTGQRVHSFYSLGRTATGRLASFGVNLQNVPEKARELIVPSDGFDYIVQADASQIEWRVTAHLSGDRLMRQWIIDGRDAHSIVAARVMGLPEPQTKKEFERFKIEHKLERDTGKMSNFATIFLVSADSLVWQIAKMTEGTVWLPEETTQQYINTFFKTFTGYQDYISNIWYALHRKERIRSPFGRSWQLPPTPAGWRRGVNYPTQSTASDIILLILRAVVRELRRRQMKSRVIGEVHDSVILEVTKRELSDIVQIVRYAFTHPDTSQFGFTLSVPLAVECSYGLNLAQLEVI